jgi:hypothetical protein
METIRGSNNNPIRGYMRHPRAPAHLESLTVFKKIPAPSIILRLIKIAADKDNFPSCATVIP